MARRLLVVGLRNPGMPNTRHNVGEAVVERALAAFTAPHNVGALSMSCLAAEAPQWGKVRRVGHVVELPVSVQVGAGSAVPVDLHFALPSTFMNESGRPVRTLVDDLQPAGLCVVHDDVERRLGAVSMKAKDAFHRLRVGVGRPPKGSDLSEFVLGEFTTEESADLDRVVHPKALDALRWWMADCVALP